MKLPNEHCAIQPAMRTIGDLKPRISPSIPLQLLLAFSSAIAVRVRALLELSNPPLIGDADQHAVLGLDGVFGEYVTDSIILKNVPVTATRENARFELRALCGSAGDRDESSVTIRGVPKILGRGEVDLEGKGKFKSRGHDVEGEIRVNKQSM